MLPEDWEHHKHYDDWLLAYEETFERTETEWGPWTIVEATNRRYTKIKIFNTIIAALERQLARVDLLPDPAYWEGVQADSAEDNQEVITPTEQVPEEN